VFLSAPSLKVKLDDRGRQRVWVRDQKAEGDRPASLQQAQALAGHYVAMKDTEGLGLTMDAIRGGRRG
jgi:hypothetical protein